MGTLYDLLGALPGDDAESLRKAFRKAAKATHPDTNPGNPDAALRFRELVRAYDILTDNEQRSTYDHLLAIALRPPATKPTRTYEVVGKFASNTMAATAISAVLVGGYAVFGLFSEPPGAAEIVADRAAGGPYEAVSTPPGAAIALSDRYYRDLGVELKALGVVYDIKDRPGQSPLAYCDFLKRGRFTEDGRWDPTIARVVGRYEEGGLGSLNELVHENGHATHISAIRNRPAFTDWTDTLFTEAFADVPSWSVYEPAWQRKYLGTELPLAIEQLKKAVELKPDYTIAFDSLARVLDRSGSADEAVGYYEKVAELDPKNAHAHRRIGEYLLRKKKYAEAATTCKIAIALDPSDKSAHLGLGAAYYNDGKPGDAISPYQQAVKLDPKWVQPIVYLADSYRQLRRFPDAKATYERALTIDDRSTDSLYWLGAIAVTEQNLAAARSYHDKLKPIDATMAANLLALINSARRS